MRWCFFIGLWLFAPLVYAISEQDFVGVWTCSTSYPDIAARLDDRYEFRTDGTASSNGTLTFFIHDGLLHYDIHSDDSWQIQNGTLLISTAQQQVTRAIRPRMQKILENKPEVAAYEKQIFTRISHHDANQKIQMTVTTLDAQQLKMHDARGNPTECTKQQL